MKQGKVMTIIAIILILVLVIFGVFAALGYVSFNFNKEGIDETEDIIESDETSLPNEVVQNEEEETEVVDAYDMTNIDRDSFLNVTFSSDDLAGNFACYNEFAGIQVRGQNGKFYLSINSDEIETKTLFTEINIEKGNEYEITGVNSNDVKEVYLLGYGQSLDVPALLFLMKDGTVKWLNVKLALSNTKFEVTNVDGVSDVSLITNMSSSGPGAGIDIIGVRNDGKIYNLTKLTVNK